MNVDGRPMDVRQTSDGRPTAGDDDDYEDDDDGDDDDYEDVELPL